MQRRTSLAGLLGSGKRSYLALAALALIGGGSACSDSNNNTTPLTATTVTTNETTNGQSGGAGTALAQPVGVTVFDQNGTPFSNATVNWAIESGGGSVASATSVTDANGNATIVWTLGPTVGLDSLKASIAGGADAFIVATVFPGPASSIRVTSGDPQTVTAGSMTAPLIIQVLDQFANPVPNAPVTWSVTGGGTLSATSTTTDATGSSQVTLTTDPAPASYTVSATSGSITPVTFTITAN